jgi:hypothetical protein
MPVSLTEAKIYDPYDVYLFVIGNDSLKYAGLNNKIKSLPENLQDFIFDTTPGDFLKDRISIPLNLNQNQSKEIAKIVMEIIMADCYLGDIIKQISQRSVIDEQKAKIIAGLIVAELFKPILEDIKKIHIEKFAKNMPRRPLEQSDDTTIDLRQ